MRRVLKPGVLARLVEAVRPDALVGRRRSFELARTQKPSEAMAQFWSFHGRRSAAWLVGPRECRRSLHRYGRFQMHRPAGAEEPEWFARALLSLRRSPVWNVLEHQDTKGVRHYVVVWKRWGKGGRLDG